MGILQDIQAGDRYRGDSIAGGGVDQLLELDYKPIQQLAQYTYLYNKSNYDQRQKDADEKIKALAALAPYDLVNGMGKDKEAVLKAQAELTDFMSNYAAEGTPKTAEEKLQKTLRFQTKIKDATKLINAANTRAIGYGVQKSAIEQDNTLSAAQKDNLIKDLDKQFNETDIYTPIQALPKYKAPNTDTGGASYKETAVVQVGDNGFIEEKTKIFDPKTTMSKSFLAGENMTLPTLPPNATPAQKQEYQQRILAGGINTVWPQAAQFYAAALNDPNYKKTVTITEPNVEGQPAVTKITDEIDYDKIKSANPILGGIFDQIDRWNNYAAQMKIAATTTYVDKAGNIKPLVAVNPDDYVLIDKSKPLTPTQLAFLKNFADASPDKIEKNYVNTGAANALKLKQIDEAGQNYRARLPYILQKLGTGTATKDEKSEYPVLKTQELVDAIGTDGKEVLFTSLTPEQQSKIQGQIGKSRITDYDKVSIKDGKITVTGVLKVKDKPDVATTVSIIPDDITKSYYNEINKNDAGKEAPERRYFKFGNPKTGNVKIKITDYDPNIQTAIKAFMKKNKLSEEDAIKLLKENKRID